MRKKNTIKKISFQGALYLTVCLSGCALGPDFQQPQLSKQAGYVENHNKQQLTPLGSINFSTQTSIPADWWSVLGSPSLSTYVEMVINNNPSMTVAETSLRQAKQNVIAQQGFFFPSIGADYAISRNKLAGNLGGNSPGIQGNGNVISTYQNPSGPIFNGPAYFNFHTAEVTLNYTPDFFGANRRAVESLEAQEKTTAYQLEATYITLTANAVAAAIQQASLKAIIEANQRIIKDYQTIVNLTQRQFELGYASAMDVNSQFTLLTQAQQQIVPFKQQLEQTNDLIHVLSGHFPSEQIKMNFVLDEFHLPHSLPVSLPSNLVRQRPDILAAEEQIHYANAQVGVQLANRFPQFNVTGAIGGAADAFNQLYHNGAGFFSLIGDLSVPIFSGGTLSAREQAAKEALAQSVAQYKLTVLNAFQNVADTMHAIQSDADALKNAETLLNTNQQLLSMTTSQEKLGFVNQLILLNADIAYQQAKINYIQMRTNQLGDAAALYVALGGGWWDKKPLDSLAKKP
ncbi:efflux transporter outer membrane subunit [Ferrovum sp. PN-J185]|uniref:efflux transporter outer membrane subunit n=1 Tax=Ferrovum sp. PN-J185 TaxID=1356306 RepID=UPI0007913BAD|nr:efflux transporter outer membrane subunit [Ferrovum sp. PN-J185]KXW55966.1 outer membrane protein OprM precursor [Ferrovum sp. PN-J185]MCC6068322.1 efflux transporter outer membrane subunit [Ferrovum sp. PN-J185]MDE1891951.1 efflux transporter outer membrane subunit [Betaproteobacteria bacterium]MDE2056945.1 efflux transporter outer membrane subunit [Betaproteobacteria bacterium]